MNLDDIRRCIRAFCHACDGSGYDCFEDRQCETCRGAGEFEICAG
jgi:DnaJ-class molecular chaperone